MPDLSTWIEHWAAFAPDKTAIDCDGEQLSYAALAGRIGALAACLDAGPGDRIAYLGQNSPHLIELVFACARLGAIAVPLNWRLTVAEHRYVLRNSGARALVHEPGFAETAESTDLRLIEAGGWDSAALPPPRGEPDSRVLIVYTSGTTGRPKGAVLSQRALLCNALNSTAMHDLSSADRVLTTIPLFHVGGLNIQTLPALHAGATVFLHRAFDVEATFAAVAPDPDGTGAGPDAGDAGASGLGRLRSLLPAHGDHRLDHRAARPDRGLPCPWRARRAGLWLHRDGTHRQLSARRAGFRPCRLRRPAGTP
jgi:fatty-acyl-CoA synthase